MRWESGKKFVESGRRVEWMKEMMEMMRMIGSLVMRIGLVRRVVEGLVD